MACCGHSPPSPATSSCCKPQKPVYPCCPAPRPPCPPGCTVTIPPKREPQPKCYVPRIPCCRPGCFHKRRPPCCRYLWWRLPCKASCFEVW
ncbi:sperm mitochondrial-associated cysteine-rich protein-like isoform X2 [Athalia rosae]|nr:sperm mitochondrial-associated cysteine-rich protein-like isoform X2 [Athalia rosae]